MKSSFINKIKNTLPCLGFSIMAGICSALFITAFKWGAEQAIHLSSTLYTAVRVHPVYLFFFIPCAALLGLGVHCLLKKFPDCKGGGIPASVAAIGGKAPIRWVASALVLPFSALLTFLGGIPLGTEGPCVQMGTAIGQGVASRLKKGNHTSCVMTGGGAAGFSLATGSPFCALLFSVEDLTKKFSLLFFTGASLSVAAAWGTQKLLALLGIGAEPLFHIETMNALDISLMFAPLLVGIICGAGSVVFTVAYHFVHKQMKKLQKKISNAILYPVLFGSTVLIGFVVANALGTGHSLTQTLFTNSFPLAMVLLIFGLRALLMMLASTAGITGGAFLPTLAFGALLGSLSANGMIYAGILHSEHYTLMVVLGTVAFLAATSRIPLTALIFALEALGGIYNLPALLLAIGAAYTIARLSKWEEFTELAIHDKIQNYGQSQSK